MVQARLIAKSTRLGDLKPGEVGFFRKSPFSDGGMVLGLANEVPIAALFARHPENKRRGAFHLSTSQEAWGGVSVMAFSSAYINCDYKSAKLMERGINHYHDEHPGALIEKDGVVGFFLGDFRYMDMGRHFGLDGREVDLSNEGPFIIYENWDLECIGEGGEVQTIFSWPPKN